MNPIKHFQIKAANKAVSALREQVSALEKNGKLPSGSAGQGALPSVQKAQVEIERLEALIADASKPVAASDPNQIRFLPKSGPPQTLSGHPRAGVATQQPATARATWAQYYALNTSEERALFFQTHREALNETRSEEQTAAAWSRPFVRQGERAEPERSPEVAKMHEAWSRPFVRGQRK